MKGYCTTQCIPARTTTRCAAVFLALAVLGMMATPMTPAQQRPISDFLEAQGTWHYPGFPDWTLFFGWTSPDSPYVLAVDYAGVAARWIEETSSISIDTTFDGVVNERALPDGTTEVWVVLHARNALTYAYDGTTGDAADWTGLRFVFGYAPPEVASDSPFVLGDCTLQARFINNARPGSALPDLQTPGLQIMFISIAAQATGSLRAGFGVPEGTRGFVQVRQTGLIATSATANYHSRVALDAFPAEKIILKPVGR